MGGGDDIGIGDDSNAIEVAGAGAIGQGRQGGGEVEYVSMAKWFTGSDGQGVATGVVEVFVDFGEV